MHASFHLSVPAKQNTVLVLFLCFWLLHHLHSWLQKMPWEETAGCKRKWSFTSPIPCDINRFGIIQHFAMHTHREISFSSAVYPELSWVWVEFVHRGCREHWAPINVTLERFKSYQLNTGMQTRTVSQLRVGFCLLTSKGGLLHDCCEKLLFLSSCLPSKTKYYLPFQIHPAFLKHYQNVTGNYDTVLTLKYQAS